MFIWQFTRKKTQRENNPFMRSEMKFIEKRIGATEAETEVKNSMKFLGKVWIMMGIGFQMENINLSFPTVHQPQVLRSRSWISKLKLIIHLQASRRVAPTMILRQEFSVLERLSKQEVESQVPICHTLKMEKRTPWLQKKMEVMSFLREWIFQRFVIQFGIRYTIQLN